MISICVPYTIRKIKVVMHIYSLAYWVVNAIRYGLKQSNIKCYWTEITRRMSTQKLVTTNATNVLGEAIVFRQCSCPSKSAKEIYDALKFKHAPFKKIQICRTQS